LPRDHIRRAWHVYRPAAEGTTARGATLRGQVAARRKHAPSRDLVGRGSALFALIEGSSEWTGVKKPVAYRIFADPELPKIASGAAHSIPDILAVVRSAKNSDCEFHFVDFVSKSLARPGPVLAGRYNAWLPFADFIWILSENDADQMAIGLPDYVGIIQVKGTTARVGRAATHSPKAGQRSGETAKLLVCAHL